MAGACGRRVNRPVSCVAPAIRRFRLLIPPVAVDPATVACSHRSLALRDGWSALVLTSCQGLAPPMSSSTTPPDDTDWRAFVEQLIHDSRALDRYALLKYSDSGEVLSARWTWPGGEMDVIAKQNRVFGWRRSMGVMFRATRARRNFERALRLLRDGIDTPVPLALLERRGGSGEAWLVCPFVHDMVDLDQILLTLLPRVDARSLRRVKNRIIDRVADLFARLQQCGWHHRDLKASNVLLTRWDRAEARVLLVDLDGLRRRRRRSAINLKSVVRLAASVRMYSGVSTTDGARFIRRLLTSIHGAPTGWRDALRTTSARARAYNQRAAGRKRNKLDGFDGG